MKRWLQKFSFAVGMAAVVLVGWLWFTLFSPWGYVPPPDLIAIAQDEKHRVFAYGTLRQPVVRWLVIGRVTCTQPATLQGFRKQGLNLMPLAGMQTRGETFMVNAEELRRIDRYERLGVRYQRSRARLASGTTAWVYQRLDDD